MLKLIGIHLKNKLYVDNAYGKFKYLIDNNGYEVSDVSKLDKYIEEIMQLTYVDVEKVRVFDFSTLEIYDVSIDDFLNSGDSIYNFDIRECRSGYIINLSSTRYRTNLILPVYFNGELLIDLTEYGGSNVIKLSDGAFSGLKILIDAKTNDMHLSYCKEALLENYDLENSYDNSELVRAHYIDYIISDNTPDEMFTGICEKFSDSILIFFEKIAFLCLDSVKDNAVIIPNGVERLVITGKLGVETNIVLPPSLNTLRGDDCKADETLISFAISKKSGIRVLKGLTGCCVNAICWYLCMEKNKPDEILDIISKHSKLKVHLY